MEQEHADLEARLADPAVARRPGRAAPGHDPLPPARPGRRRRPPPPRRCRPTPTRRASCSPTPAGDERALLEDELAATTAALAASTSELRELMVPPDPYAGRDVIVEIRGAEGGEEANLFARDLYDMYRAYAARHGLKVETLSVDASDLGGFNEVTFSVAGDDAWPRFKYEGGAHRVQRVPVTESQGRIHTSSATVLVLPEADEVDVADRRQGPADRRVPLQRAGRPERQHHRLGGAHHPRADGHRRVDAGRAQPAAEPGAGDEVLRARLLEVAERERDAERSAERRSQVGGGGRGEKIRTYNFKENRLTDHRIGFTIYRLADVLAGDLDDVVAALAADERARQLADGD